MRSIKYKSEQLNTEIEIDYVVQGDGPIENSFYFLDGQNAFNDNMATYGRSLRALNHLDKTKKSYIAVAIHSPKADKDRLNMYSPFKIDKGYIKSFVNNPLICQKFISELENVIVPSIEKRWQIKKRHLIASSLAASLAIYINSVSSIFNSMCILSNSNFIFDKAMYEHLALSHENKAFIYLGVGLKEKSDDIYDETLYLNAYKKYKNYLNKIGANYVAKIKIFGKHNEASWEKHLKTYIKKIR